MWRLFIGEPDSTVYLRRPNSAIGIFIDYRTLGNPYLGLRPRTVKVKSSVRLLRKEK